jgi:hypothetical protein
VLGTKAGPRYYKTSKYFALQYSTFIIPCTGWATISVDWGMDIGAALAAATERESRLRFERSLWKHMSEFFFVETI